MDQDMIGYESLATPDNQGLHDTDAGNSMAESLEQSD